ncbi:hypothetical protein [Komagataeibacter saccharivorans]|uniref:hypothetical protein n=1 Tax=Komagataeibacter saccharivorans TaxID=265959 RepID=UPI0011AF48E6|nr:hypothetical protein [Komagataeibacter saccharivorans]
MKTYVFSSLGTYYRISLHPVGRQAHQTGSGPGEYFLLYHAACQGQKTKKKQGLQASGRKSCSQPMDGFDKRHRLAQHRMQLRPHPVNGLINGPDGNIFVQQHKQAITVNWSVGRMADQASSNRNSFSSDAPPDYREAIFFWRQDQPSACK